MDTADPDKLSAWRPPAVGLAIVAYCAMQADDLVVAWRHSPFDRVSWTAMLLWLAPLWILTRGEVSRRLDPQQKALFTVALIFVLIGEMASMNAIKYAALTFALAGLVPWQPVVLVWIAGAVCWMPVFGYFASKFLSFSRTNKLIILGSRLSITLVAVALIWMLRRKNQKPAA